MACQCIFAACSELMMRRPASGVVYHIVGRVAVLLYISLLFARANRAWCDAAGLAVNGSNSRGPGWARAQPQGGPAMRGS